MPAISAEIVLRGEFSKDLRSSLEGGSLLFEQKTQEEPASSLEVLSAAQADYKRLLAVLYDHGYFAPYISIRLDGREAADVPLINAPQSVGQVDISVEQGQKFRFGRATIAPVAPATEIPKEFKPGETAKISVLKDTVATGIEGWRDHGYAKARLSREEITANHGKGLINADLGLDPGARLRFGPLIVKGNQKVRTERIQEIAELPTGDIYSPQELKDAATRLRRTGAFKSVALIEADEASPDGSLPITLQVAEELPRRFGFGAEIATTEGLTLSGYWLHRNLLGGAESLRFDAEVSGIGGTAEGGTDYVFSVLFTRPATFNEDTNFYAGATIERLDEPNYLTEQVTLETGFERIADEHRSYRLGVGYQRARTEDAFGKNSYTLLLLPAGLTYDYRDKEFDARTGYYANVEMTPFAAISGADNGLFTAADLRWYKSFGADQRTTFAVRGQESGWSQLYGVRHYSKLCIL